MRLYNEEGRLLGGRRVVENNLHAGTTFVLIVYNGYTGSGGYNNV